VVQETDIIIQKGCNLDVDSYSGFWDNAHRGATDLEATLRRLSITDVYVCGLAYDYCVGFSALDSAEAGFRTFFVQDASRGVSPKTVEEMRGKFDPSGVRIISSNQIPKF
jgi:nicotinamidase/pyrazinamidase